MVAPIPQLSTYFGSKLLSLSSMLMSFCKWGDQTDTAYSRCGRTSAR